jgi:hypothetical protein
MRKLSRKAWPFQYQFEPEYNNDRLDPRVKWLWDYFGEARKDDWNYVSVGPFAVVCCFKNEQDYTMFILRWS